MYHFDKIEGKNHMTMSIDGGKVFDKIQHSFLIKISTKYIIENIYLQIINTTNESQQLTYSTVKN
jgi:hypothetical protein